MTSKSRYQAALTLLAVSAVLVVVGAAILWGVGAALIATGVLLGAAVLLLVDVDQRTGGDRR